MISKRGICYDLQKTPFTSTQNGLTYCFSSQLHLDKFESRLKENREVINYSLTKRFNVCVDVSTLADVVLYKKIETRGFLIQMGEVDYKCQKSIKLNGVKATSKNSKG